MCGAVACWTLLLSVAVAAGDRVVPVTLVHFGFSQRLSAWTDPVDLRQKVQRVRQLYPNVLVLNPTGLETAGAVILRLDASAARRQDINSTMRLPYSLLAANVEEEARTRRVRPSLIVNVGGSLLVGVVGYTAGSSALAAVGREARRLKRLGVPVVIALGDAGFPIDQMLALHVPEVDVVLAGPERGRSSDGYPLALKSRPSGRSVPLLKARDSSLCVTQLMFTDAGKLLVWHGFVVPLRSSATSRAEVS